MVRLVNGYDIVKDFRKTRSMIGLVPQELTLETFETVFTPFPTLEDLMVKPTRIYRKNTQRT